MRKKERMFLPFVCVAIMLMGMTVLAAENRATNYCEDCGAQLVTGAKEAGHWTTTHRYYTGITHSDGNKEYKDCTILHVMTEIEKICPAGHGVKASFTQYDMYHSDPNCPEK